MNILKFFYDRVYSIPALILHEFSHIITAFIIGGRLAKIEIEGVKVRLKIDNLKNITQVRIVAMAPLLIPGTFIILSFFYTYFIYFLLYSITVYKTTLPSSIDFETAKLNTPNFLK